MPLVPWMVPCASPRCQCPALPRRPAVGPGLNRNARMHPLTLTGTQKGQPRHDGSGCHSHTTCDRFPCGRLALLLLTMTQAAEAAALQRLGAGILGGACTPRTPPTDALATRWRRRRRVKELAPELLANRGRCGYALHCASWPQRTPLSLCFWNQGFRPQPLFAHLSPSTHLSRIQHHGTPRALHGFSGACELGCSGGPAGQGSGPQAPRQRRDEDATRRDDRALGVRQRWESAA